MVTLVSGEGKDGQVGILFLILRRKVIGEVVELVKQYNPNAFYTIEDMRFVRDPEFLPPPKRIKWTKSRLR